MLKIGIFGVGHLGKIHLSQWATMKDVEIVGFFDPSDANADSVAQQYPIPRFTSAEELILASDAIDIIAPTTQHFKICEQAIRNGKHIFVEKPMTNTMDEAKTLVKLVEEANVKFQVGHVERFNPAFLALRGYHLKPMFIEVHRLAEFNPRGTDVSVILDLMIHDIEVILHIVRSPVVSIDAVGISVLSKGEDIANVRFHFENGCVANVTASRISQDKLRKIRVFQENAYLSLDYQNQSGYLLRLAEENVAESSMLGKLMGLATDSSIVTAFNGRRIVREPVEVEKGEPLRIELESFLHCARAGAKPRVSGHQAADALDIALEITRRIEEADPRKK